MSAPACPPPREPSRPKVPPPPRRLRYPRPCVRAGVAFPLRRRPQLHAARRAARKISRACSTRSGSRAACWCRAAPMAATMRAMLDALARKPERLRGVAVADAECRRRSSGAGTRSACAACGSTISFAAAPCTIAAACRSMRRKALAPMMAELGWHVQLWIDVKDLADTMPLIKAIGRPIVVDHMGRSDAVNGTQTPGFQSLLRLLGDGGCWVKVSGAHRVSQRAAGLSRRPAVPRSAGARQSRAPGVGQRLAASAHGERDARRRTPVRAVPRLGARRGDAPAHPGRQSGAALRFPG